MSRANDTIRVLHVDDEPNFAAMVVEFLERENDCIAVDIAEGPREGLDRIQAEEFDCIVSDYDMPATTGIEFLELVRQEYEDLPFVLYTGKGSEEVASDAISAGVTDYLQKDSGTTHYEVLANRIENAVEQYRARNQAIETERRLQTIAENSNDILWMYTADWQELLFMNSAYEEIWGRSIEELREYPPSFQRGVHPDDRSITREAMDRLSNGESIDIEFRVNAEQDFQRWVWVKGGPVFDSEGEVEKVVGFARDITSRKRERQQLEQLKDRYQGFIETTSDVISVIDGNGIVQYESPSAQRVLGYTKDELVGENVFEYIHPDDREQVMETFSDVIDAPGTVTETLEYRFKHANGSWVWLETAGSNQTHTTLDGYVVSSRDVTERKAQEERFQAYVEEARDIITVLDADGTYLYQSPSAERILGHDPEALVGTNAFENIHPDDREDVKTQIETALKDPQVTPTMEYRVPHVDGSWRWVEARGNNQLDNPAIEGIVVTARDITERKDREQELEEYRTAVEAASNVIVTIDTSNEIRTVNPAVEEVFGYEPGELIGEQLTVLMSPETASSHETAFHRYLETGEKTLDWAYVEVEGEHRDGSPVPLSVSFGELTHDNEQLFVGVIRDMTVRKAREQELRELNRRHELALAATKTGIWEWNIETNEVVWSEELEDLLGLDPGSFDGTFEANKEYLHPESTSQFEQASQRAVEADGVFDEEFRMVRADGEVIWVHGVGKVVTDDGPNRMLGTATEITERKEREKELG